MRPLNKHYTTLLVGLFVLSSYCALQAQTELTTVFEGQDTFYLLPENITHTQLTKPLSEQVFPDGDYREYVYAEEESDDSKDPARIGYYEFRLLKGVLSDTLRHFTADGQLLNHGEYRHGKRNGYWYEYADTTDRVTQEVYYEDDHIMQMVFFAPEGHRLRRDIHFYEPEQTEKVLTTWFHPNGRIARQGITTVMQSGQRVALKQGQWRTYYLDGILRAIEYYQAGDYDGQCEYFHPDGNPDRIATYKKGKLKEEMIYELSAAESEAVGSLR